MNNHKGKYKPSNNHLSQAMLLRYKEGTLTDAEMHRVEMHLLDCELCKDASEGILSIENKDYKADINKIKASFHHRFPRKNQPVSQWKGLAVASVAIFILVTLGIMINNRIGDDNRITSRERSHNNTTIIENDLVIAENIQDTIINHHIALNDPLTQKAEKKSIVAKPLSNEDKRKENLDEVINSEYEEEILVMSESFSESNDEIIIEDRIVVEYFKDGSSEAPKFENALGGKVAGVQIEKSKALNIISGKVVDEEGMPLPGVNILVKGTSKGVVTDIGGNYQISAAPHEVLVFNSIGFMTEELRVTERSSSTVKMQPDIRALSEVVVIGYGTRSSSSSDSVIPKVNPQPETGMRKYKQYLKENLRYPEAAKQENIEGNVTVQFSVNPNGAISEIMVIKSLGYGIDDEAIRLIEEGPAWKPAMINGNPVKETVKLKIPFKM